jgi:hypothetical protein
MEMAQGDILDGGAGLSFMAKWICHYNIKGITYQLYYGRFHGEKPCWYYKEHVSNKIHELLPCNIDGSENTDIYRLYINGVDTRFSYGKIKRYAKSINETFNFFREDFVPK